MKSSLPGQTLTFDRCKYCQGPNLRPGAIAPALFRCMERRYVDRVPRHSLPPHHRAAPRVGRTCRSMRRLRVKKQLWITLITSICIALIFMGDFTWS